MAWLWFGWPGGYTKLGTEVAKGGWVDWSWTWASKAMGALVDMKWGKIMRQSPDVVLLATTALTGHPKSEQKYCRWMLVLIFLLICEGRCLGYDLKQSYSTSCSSRIITVVCFERDGLWFSEKKKKSQVLLGENCSGFSLSLTRSSTDASAAGEPIACPSCSSDHVVILPSEVCSSTPLPPGPDSTSEDLSDSVLEGGSQQEGPEEVPALTSESGKFYIGGEDSSEMDTSNSTRTPELSGEHDGTLPSSSRSSDGGCRKKELGMKSQYLSLSHTDSNGGSLMGSYHYSGSHGPTPSQLSLNSESEETWNLSPREYVGAVQGLGVCTVCGWALSLVLAGCTTSCLMGKGGSFSMSGSNCGSCEQSFSFPLLFNRHA